MRTDNVDRFDNWEDMLCNLRYVYTISFKDACKRLKASRSWINRYIRPNVRCLYLSNMSQTDGKTKNWVAIASMMLKKPMTEKIWFKNKDFMEFLNSCVHSMTRQTRQIPVSLLMTEDDVKKYYRKLDKLKKEMELEEDVLRKLKIQAEINKCHEDFLKADENTMNLYQNRLFANSKRSAVPHVPVEDIKIENVILEWVAPHELKDYGDTDELVYRHFFENGYIKIVLHIPDIDGVIGEKTFYVRDRNQIYRMNENEKMLIVSEQAYRQYKQSIML